MQYSTQPDLEALRGGLKQSFHNIFNYEHVAVKEYFTSKRKPWQATEMM
jgi:hypothetical protein